MPGLGGDPEHFHWLAEALTEAGWDVVIVEHPGSDAEAVQALWMGGQSRLTGKSSASKTLGS